MEMWSEYLSDEGYEGTLAEKSAQFIGFIKGLGFLFVGGEEGVWYDPSDMSTLFQDSAGTTPVTSNGDPVGLILDKSGNGNNAIQAISNGYRPTYQDGELVFDGVDDYLYTASIDMSSSDNMFVGLGLTKSATASGTQVIVELSPSVNTEDGSFHLRDNGAASDQFRSRGTVLAASGGGRIALDTPAITTVNSDISDVNITRWVNGSEVANVSNNQGTGNYGDWPLYLGSRAGTEQYYEGSLSQVIVRNSKSSTLERTSTESYLASKTGVTL